MAMTFDDRRKTPRVQFEKPLPAKVMAIDGTWSCECELIDMSESGARITLADSAAELTEFFLLLSSFGSPVYRRCRRAWIDGTQMGVAFERGAATPKRSTRRGRRARLE
jgi:hypothetical protein